MSVKIDMDMPRSCLDCRWSKRGIEIGRIICRLTNHEFPSFDATVNRFPTCPLKEVK